MITDLIHTVYQQELQVKAGQSGSLKMEIDVSNLLFPPPPSFYIFSPLSQPSKVSLAGVTMSQTVQTKLSPVNTLAVTGTVANSPNGVISMAGATLQHQISPTQQISTSALIGSRPVLGIDYMQMFSAQSQGTASFSLQQEGAHCGLQLFYQCSPSLLGRIKLDMGNKLEQAVSSVGIIYARSNQRIEAELSAGSTLGVSSSFQTTLSEASSTQLKIKGALTTVHSHLDTGVSKSLSPFSRIGLSAEMGSFGVALKCKFVSTGRFI